MRGLDLGCGTGTLMVALARSCPRRPSFASTPIATSSSGPVPRLALLVSQSSSSKA